MLSGLWFILGLVMFIVDLVILFVVGGSYVCVVILVGEVWCWGCGDFG